MIPTSFIDLHGRNTSATIAAGRCTSALPRGASSLRALLFSRRFFAAAATFGAAAFVPSASAEYAWSVNQTITTPNSVTDQSAKVDALSDVALAVSLTVQSAGRLSFTHSESRFYVGYDRSGNLLVQGGGGVSGVDSYLGYSSSGEGSATITGANSTWSMSGLLRVGVSGTGSLAIESSGKVSVADKVILGTAPFSTGLVRLTSGGILETRYIRKSEGQVSLEINGGTICALADTGAADVPSSFFSEFVTDDIELSGESLGEGQVAFTFDTNGKNVAINTGLSYVQGSGHNLAIGFAKIGTGTLNLSGQTTKAHGAGFSADVIGNARIAEGTFALDTLPIYIGEGAFASNSIDVSGTAARLRVCSISFE
ncbi:MAG: hypothetical protein LBD01_03470 [Puniceicoccales bacterium]|jgi:T5SS/PEP-CTERM-associated repeat protein|nr:hypothetical protein [Puniceicoccales bacterium]